MKVLGISASPRGKQSQTVRLLHAVLAGAEAAGAEAECIDLCKLDIHFCVACGACYRTGRCIHRDDFAPLYAKMLASDGMVWASPNYFGSVSAQMKVLIDRMADTIHCQLFTGKYACAVATSGGPSHADTTGYLARVLTHFGATTVGVVGASALQPGAVAQAELAAWKLGQGLLTAITEKHTDPQQDEAHQLMRDRFKSLVTANKDAWVHEYEHWLDMGWL